MYRDENQKCSVVRYSTEKESGGKCCISFLPSSFSPAERKPAGHGKIGVDIVLFVVFFRDHIHRDMLSLNDIHIWDKITV